MGLTPALMVLSPLPSRIERESGKRASEIFGSTDAPEISAPRKHSIPNGGEYRPKLRTHFFVN